MDFTKLGKALLVELFNLANPGLNVPAAAVTFNNPSANAGADAATRDTAITMTAVPGSGYKGAANLTYQRLHLKTDIADKGDPSDIVFDATGMVNQADIVAQLNARFSINLVAGQDYVDAAIPAFPGVEPNETQDVVIAAMSGSLVYKGTLTVTLTAGDVDLAGRTGGMDGFSYEKPAG